MQVRPRFGRIRDTIHHPTAQTKVSLGNRYYSFVHFLLTIDTGKRKQTQNIKTALINYTRTLLVARNLGQLVDKRPLTHS